MRFNAATGTIATGTVGPDPVANPELVPDVLLLRLPLRRPMVDTPVETLMLTLANATAGDTITGELWLLDEATAQNDAADDPSASPGARRFYRVQTGVVLTANRIVPVVPFTNPMPLPGGVWYFRPTADTLTTSGQVRAVCV